jgi:hypothetical protein
MIFLFSGRLLLPFHDHLRVVRDLEEHLADRLEQSQAVPTEFGFLGHYQDAVKKIVEAGLEAEDNLLGLGKIAFGDHRGDILLDDGKNGIELAFLSIAMMRGDEPPGALILSEPEKEKSYSLFYEPAFISRGPE